MNNDKQEDLSPGVLLQQERLKQNLSINSVATKLYLTCQAVKYLEEDNFANLPGDVFVRGYLRSYAKILKLDDGLIIDKYEAIVMPISNNFELKTLQVNEYDKLKPIYWLVSGLGILLLCALAWFVVNNNSKNVMQLNSDEILVVNPNFEDLSLYKEDETLENENIIDSFDSVQQDLQNENNEEPSNQEKLLRLTFSDECWVKIVDADDKILIDAIYKKGNTIEVYGKEPLKINLGNGKGVRVIYADEVVKFKLRNSGSASFTLFSKPE